MGRRERVGDEVREGVSLTPSLADLASVCALKKDFQERKVERMGERGRDWQEEGGSVREWCDRHRDTETWR